MKVTSSFVLNGFESMQKRRNFDEIGKEKKRKEKRSYIVFHVYLMRNLQGSKEL